MLISAAAAGFAFSIAASFATKKAWRILRANIARRRFSVVRGSLRDDMSAEDTIDRLRGE
jgi:hypothetical protein